MQSQVGKVPVFSFVGKCIFDSYTAADIALSDEIYEAAVSKPLSLIPAPYRNLTVADDETTYWDLMSMGTGNAYSYLVDSPPTVRPHF